MKPKAGWWTGLFVLVAVGLLVQLWACSRNPGTVPARPLGYSVRPLNGAAPDTSCGQSHCSILKLDGGIDDIWRSPSGKIWIVGFSTLGLVHWDGQRWLHYGNMGGFKSVWGSGDDDVWAVGENVVHWDGKRWESKLAGLESSYGLLWTVWGSGRGDVWAGGEFGRVVHWSGTRWEERRIGAERDVLVISGSSKDDVWAGTIDDELARWDGRSWRVQTPPPFESVVSSVESLAVVAPDDVWLADGQGLSRWDGRHWTRVPIDLRSRKIVVTKGASSRREPSWTTSPRQLANCGRMSGFHSRSGLPPLMPCSWMISDESGSGQIGAK